MMDQVLSSLATHGLVLPFVGARQEGPRQIGLSLVRLDGFVLAFTSTELARMSLGPDFSSVRLSCADAADSLLPTDQLMLDPGADHAMTISHDQLRLAALWTVVDE